MLELGLLGCKLLKRLRRPLIPLFKLIRCLAPVVIGLLAIWIIGGDLLATQQEQKVDQAREQFIQQFLNTDTNNSALKLEELLSPLGLGKLLGTKATPTRYLHLPVPKANKKSFESIRKDLDRYLDSQLDKPNDAIDPLPENIHQYLADYAVELEAIRTHALSSELPRWETTYISAVGDVGAILPSFLSAANFQKTLAVDILDKTRQGQLQSALKTLEVAWKLNLALLEQPSLIAQLVFLINSRLQAVVMRKMQELPTEWQDRLNRLNQYDLPQAFLRGLYSEAFLSISARKYPGIDILRLFKSINTNDSFVTSPQWLSALSDPFLKPYARLSAVNYFDYTRQIVLKLPEQDFCSFNPNEFEQQQGHRGIWWSIFPRAIFDTLGGLASQWRKVGKAVLRFELTQKVLQVKELIQKQGRLPKQIPGIESSVCQEAKWIYQLATDGTASISFSKDLEWMRPQNSSGSPGDLLKYSIMIK